MKPSKEQELLTKLYECQEIIFEINKKNKESRGYILLSEVIFALEEKIIVNSEAII